MRVILLLVIISSFISSCTWIKEHQYEYEETEPYLSEIDDDHPPGMPHRDGNCYAKALIQDEFRSDTIVLH